MACRAISTRSRGLSLLLLEGPKESISLKAEEARGLTPAKLSGAPIRSRNPPVRTSDVRITGEKLETRLDLTLWIIESLVGNP
jgi:hypothetical protein